MGRWRSSLQTVIMAAIASSTVFTSDGFAGLDVGGWEMVMTSGRSGKSQPSIIEDAAIKASPVDRTLLLTEPGESESTFRCFACELAAKSYEAFRIEITTRCALVPSSPLLSPLH